MCIFGGRTHTLETDFIHLASQFWMPVHLFHLVPNCGFLPRSGQVTKPLSQYNPFSLSDDTTVSINLTFCKAFRAHQRSSGKAKVFRDTHASCIAELGNHNGFILLIQLGSDDNLKHGPTGCLADLSKVLACISS